MPPNPPSSDLLLRATRRMLRPLVRLLMRGGVTFPVVAELLRGLYVDVAQHDVLTEPKSRTDSRIAVLTGVHRKELRRLREGEQEAEPPPAKLTLGSLLVARWLTTEPWVEAPGVPKRLPRSASDYSFEALVASVTRDVRPRAVLEEWLAQNVVEVDAEDRIVLRDAAYLPQAGQEEQLFYFARNLHDHIAAAAANVIAAPAPFLDRSVHYDGLSPEAAATLEAEARVAAVRLLVELNTRAMQLAVDTAASGATRRVNLGVYLFAEDEAKEPPA